MANVLFVNFFKNQCGIHQYGFNFFNQVKGSKKYNVSYLNVSNPAELANEINKGVYNFVFVNSPFSVSFLNPANPRVFKSTTMIYLLHDLVQLNGVSFSEDSMYQYCVFGDGGFTDFKNPKIFNIGRVILDYQKNITPPSVPTFGSFGFNSYSKGYLNVINRIQEEFDEAVIRLNIPVNTMGNETLEHTSRDDDKYHAAVIKPGIKLEITHNFYDKIRMLDFLAANSVNTFFYNNENNSQLGGIASSTDTALSARTPIAIADCPMFRHIIKYDLPINISKTSLKDILNNGIKALDPIYRDWSKDKFVYDFEDIMDKIQR